MIGAPLQFMTPEQLTAAAQGAFRPPGLMSGGGMPGMGQPQGGMGLGEGLGLAGLALGMGKGLGSPFGGDGTRTGRDADLGGYSNVGPGGMVDVGNGQMLPNPNQPQSYETWAQRNIFRPIGDFFGPRR